MPASNSRGSGARTPNPHASGSRALPPTNSDNGPWDSDDSKHRATPAPSPRRNSADPQWEMSGRPLDRPRSRQPSDYGAPLPSAGRNSDWNMADEMEQQHAIPLRAAASTPNHWQGHAGAQQSRPFLQVNSQQTPIASTDATAADAAIQNSARRGRNYYAPTPPAPQPALVSVTGSAPGPSPEGAVSVVKEITLISQLANTQRRVSFTANTKPPVTTIQATGAQASSVAEQIPAVTTEQLMAIQVSYLSLLACQC